MKQYKVILLVPNYRLCRGDESTFWHYIPYNLCILAAMIRDICDVEIIDAYTNALSIDDIENIFWNNKPDLIGITIMMDQFAEAGHITANAAKRVLPDVKVVMGGVHVSVAPSEVMKNSSVDYAIIGEGEYVFHNLIEHLINRKKSIPTSGICYRNGEEVVNKGRADFIHDLDKLPLPAYDLIDFQKYSHNYDRKSVGAPKKFPYARLFTSRGCPFKCCFCQVEHIAGRKFRSRSPESILDEIEWLKNQYGVKSLIFDDDNLFTDRKRAISIFQGMLARNLAIPWGSIATAVFCLDSYLIELLKLSGCVFLNIAIESGSRRILEKVVQKPINYHHAIEMVKIARNAGIYVAVNFIIGFPTETWDEILETINFAEKIDANYVKIFHAIPLRNTRLWDLCEEYNAFKDGFNIKDIRWSSGQISSPYFNPNDLTILRAYEWDRINFSDPLKRKQTAKEMGISEDELLNIRRSTLLNAQKNVLKNCN